eukprot:1180159-Prorocentrum_minimum.AAC.2
MQLFHGNALPVGWRFVISHVLLLPYPRWAIVQQYQVPPAVLASVLGTCPSSQLRLPTSVTTQTRRSTTLVNHAPSPYVNGLTVYVRAGRETKGPAAEDPSQKVSRVVASIRFSYPIVSRTSCRVVSRRVTCHPLAGCELLCGAHTCSFGGCNLYKRIIYSQRSFMCMTAARCCCNVASKAPHDHLKPASGMARDTIARRDIEHSRHNPGTRSETDPPRRGLSFLTP